jgi:TatD DNase family protein
MRPVLIDTHAHLQDDAFREDLPDVLRRAGDAGVIRALTVGTTLEDSAAAVRLARAHPALIAAVGIHPNEAADVAVGSVQAALERLIETSDVAAVGETGLDFYRDRASPARQEELLEAHLSVASRADLPVIIHSRQALDRLRSILTAWRTSVKGGIMHCFPGGVDDARFFIDMGYLVGVGGTVTFGKSRLADTVRAIGLGHVVLETDSPYLAPTPWRGRRNEPAYVAAVAETLALLLGEPLARVARVTTQNACRLLHLAPPPHPPAAVSSDTCI